MRQFSTFYVSVRPISHIPKLDTKKSNFCTLHDAVSINRVSQLFFTSLRKGIGGRQSLPLGFVVFPPPFISQKKGICLLCINSRNQSHTNWCFKHASVTRQSHEPVSPIPVCTSASRSCIYAPLQTTWQPYLEESLPVAGLHLGNSVNDQNKIRLQKKKKKRTQHTQTQR